MIVLDHNNFFLSKKTMTISDAHNIMSLSRKYETRTKIKREVIYSEIQRKRYTIFKDYQYFEETIWHLTLRLLETTQRKLYFYSPWLGGFHI